MPWVGYLAVALCGVLLGWLLAAVLIRRAEGPRVDATSHQDAALAAEVVARSDSAYLVTDRGGNVLLANQRARELRVVRAGMPDTRVLEAIARTGVSGEPIDVDLGTMQPAADTTAGGSPVDDAGDPSMVHAVAQPLGAEMILVSAVDESAARRVETIRRDFVANVSHELKTPVGAIALLAEAVLDGSDDEESVRHFAGKMLAESTRLGALVNELIALSRLQGGLPLQDLAVVEVDAVVAEAMGRLETVAETAGITVISDPLSGLLVRGDRTLLVTALTNLIDNAISYSPPGTPVSVTRSSRDGSIDISVTDRGIGIAPEHQQRVFERFFRVDPARSRATGGTGLGLAIVKHVAANHGGQALLWSRAGTGSTFTLRLPQLPETVDTARPAQPDPAAATNAGGADRRASLIESAGQREGAT
ncbi:sensor histidine kinase [Nakamurella lactea]|uniref:sensor histidine kinase n=1 Tax=Nakamurella lactea TaxID=459515 RepID=UPI0004029694|nr:ATP-binding protein [Nakamurella lactea]